MKNDQIHYLVKIDPTDKISDSQKASEFKRQKLVEEDQNSQYINSKAVPEMSQSQISIEPESLIIPSTPQLAKKESLDISPESKDLLEVVKSISDSPEDPKEINDNQAEHIEEVIQSPELDTVGDCKICLDDICLKDLF